VNKNFFTLKYFICFIILFLSFSCKAGNYSFLNDAAISNFTTADTKLFIAAQEKALNRTRDGVKVSWRNPHTKVSGYVLPIKTANINGQTCRWLIFYNNAYGVTGKNTFKFCKVGSVWQAFPP